MVIIDMPQPRLAMKGPQLGSFDIEELWIYDRTNVANLAQYVWALPHINKPFLYTLVFKRTPPKGLAPPLVAPAMRKEMKDGRG